MNTVGIGKTGTVESAPRDAYSDYTVRQWRASPDLTWAIAGFTLLALKPGARLHRGHRWRLLPDGSAYLLLHVCEGPVPLSRWRLVGPRTVFHDIDRRGRRFTLITRFRTATASWFLPCALSELTDSSRAAQQLSPEFKRGLAGVAAAAARLDWDHCIRLTEDVLRRCRRPSRRQGRLALEAVRHLEDLAGRVSVADLGRSSGWSSRYLRQLIGAAAGMPPKRLARILRLRATVHLADQTPQRNWADLAAATGYYDQSHLIAEFGSLTGESPRRLCARLFRE